MSLALLGAYRTAGTTHLGGNCRFYPSCSAYAHDALHTHKPLKAYYLIAKRLLRCHPFGSFGYDPVPTNGSTCAK